MIAILLWIRCSSREVQRDSEILNWGIIEINDYAATLTEIIASRFSIWLRFFLFHNCLCIFSFLLSQTRLYFYIRSGLFFFTFPSCLNVAQLLVEQDGVLNKNFLFHFFFCKGGWFLFKYFYRNKIDYAFC